VVGRDEPEHLAQDAQRPEDRSGRYGRAVRFGAVRRGEHARQGPQIVLRHFLSVLFFCVPHAFSRFFMPREKQNNENKTTKTKQQKEKKKKERKKKRTKQQKEQNNKKKKEQNNKKKEKMKRQKEGK
jgi:hypothetical protein